MVYGASNGQTADDVKPPLSFTRIRKDKRMTLRSAGADLRGDFMS